MNRILLLLAVFSGVARADKVSFIQLCESPKLAAATLSTFDALRKLAFRPRASRQISCELLAEKLANRKELYLPGQTFDYYETPDLTPIAHLDHLEKLDITAQKVQSLDPLLYLQLKHLRIAGVTASLAPLGQMKSLTQLTVTLSNQLDAERVKKLDRLEYLEASVASGLDLRELPDSLHSLVLSGEGRVQLQAPRGLLTLHLSGIHLDSFAFLQPAQNTLKSLHLIRVGFDHLSPIQGMMSLEEVQFTDSKIENLSFLSSLSLLKKLDVSRNHIRDLKPLAVLFQLRVLTLDQNPLYDLQGIENLFRLEKLSARQANLPGAFHLRDLTRLRILDLTKNNFHTAPIADLENGNYQLEELYLGGNGLRSIDPTIRNFTRLKILVLGDNKLTDVSALAEVASLERLHLEDNKLVNVDSLSKLKKLKQLYLWSNVLPKPFVCPVQPESVCAI